MSYTIQQSINFAQTFIGFSPEAVGTGNEPAISLANMIQNTILNAPFTWGWNRNENSSTSTVAGTQDYTIPLTDFSFLEKVTLTDPTGAVYEVQDVYNTAALGIADASVNKRARPNSACVVMVTYGTSIKLRFMGVPDKIYLITLTYQKLPTPLSALTGANGTWLIPDQYIDIYNNLFLAESMALVDDARETLYRQRGVGALLSKAEGLTEMQKNDFLEQYWMRSGRSDLVGTIRAQQGNQARAV